MKYDKKKVYGSLELIVNICVLRKMRIAALISKENQSFFYLTLIMGHGLLFFTVRLAGVDAPSYVIHNEQKIGSFVFSSLFLHSTKATGSYNVPLRNKFHVFFLFLFFFFGQRYKKVILQ